MDICETIPFSTLLSLYFQGKATGNKGALYSRSFIQKSLNALGNFVQVRKKKEEVEWNPGTWDLSCFVACSTSGGI